MKKIFFIAEMLTDIKLGIYTQWIYYLDGSIEEKKIPKGKIIFQSNLIQL